MFGIDMAQRQYYLIYLKLETFPYLCSSVELKKKCF